MPLLHLRLLDLNNISGNISLSALLQQRIIQMTPIITAEEEAEIMPCLPSCESSRWSENFIIAQTSSLGIVWQAITLSPTNI